MNNWLARIGCVAAIVMMAIGCRKVQYEPDPSGAPLVTVVYGASALGDRSYNDLIYSGVERAALARGLRTMQLSPSTVSEGLAILQTYFEQMCAPRDTVRRLLIVTGAEYDDYLRRNSNALEGNPFSDLLYLETKEQLDGKGSTIYLPYYGVMYEAGAVASAFSSKTLLVAANPVLTAINESVKGFTDGFNANFLPADEVKELMVEWLSDEAGGGFDIDDGEAMQIVYDDELYAVAPLVFPVCGGASSTFYRLCDLFGGCDYIGIDAANLSPHCPFSVVKHIDKAIDLCIGQWMSSDGMPKHQNLSFADGWTEMVLHPYTEEQKNVVEHILPPQLQKTIHEDAVKMEACYE